MQSTARQLRRGRLVKKFNKITGEVELFRIAKHTLIYTGISYKLPKSEITL